MGSPQMNHQETPPCHRPGCLCQPSAGLSYTDVVPKPAWAKPQANRHRRRPVALLLLALATGTVFLHFRSVRGSHQVITQDTSPAHHALITVSSVLPPGVDTKECVEWADKRTSRWNSAARTSIQLPLNTESLFFLREGTAINGAFQVFMADPKKYELGKVHVEVSMSSRYETFIDQTQICHLTKEGGGDGLGIKANFIHSRFDNTRIEVKVYIPVPGGEEMKLKNFETDLPYLRQVLYMAYPITFGSLKLRGEGQDVDAALIVADTVDIRTSDAIAGGVFETTGPISLFTKNGMISGRFNTSSVVSLVTSNAPIFAIVHLSNDENTCKDTELIMQTTNGAIEGTITLTSLANDGLGGLFDVFSVTSNAASHLMFTSISPRAKLDLASHTTAHNAMVELDRAYEGEITLETTSDSRADVHLWSLLNRHDPEHRGRKRAAIVAHDKSPGEVHGRVWWDEDGQDLGRGTVEVKTSYGKVELRM